MAQISSDIISSETLFTELSGSLPVYVSPQDITKNPQLSLLLKDLSLRLTPTGSLRATHMRYTHASTALRHARQKYLEETTLHRVSQDVLLVMSDSEDRKEKIMRKMLEAVTLSELQDHLHLGKSRGEGITSWHNTEGACGTSRELSVFGITSEDVLASSKALAPEAYTKKLSSAMETRLEQEWVKINSFLDPVGFGNYNPREITKIVEGLETTKEKLTEESNKLIHNVIQTDCLTQKVFGLLFDYSKILKSLISKQRLSRYSAQHLSSCLVTLNAHFLKLRCLELEILVDTYTSQTIPALKAIQAHLQQRKTQAEQSLVKLRHTMDTYKDLDPRFQELLKEYAKLQEDIIFAKKSTDIGSMKNPV